MVIRFLIALLPLLVVLAPAAAETKPNIIFILCDDLGWGDLGVLHQNNSTHVRRHKTPQLDQMAAEGMQLRAHYCPAPVCAPSRSSLLTGVHQGHAAVRDNQFDKMLIDNHTLATVMRQAGYRTALVGKYGLQGAGQDADSWPAYPTKRGFDEFYGYVRHGDGHVHYPADTWELGNSEPHRSRKEVWHNEQEVSSGLSKCYTTDLFTARSKHWIEEHTREHSDQPFFLYLAYDTPHAALQVPSVPYPQGAGLSGGVQWLGENGHMINTAEGQIDSHLHPDYVGQDWSDVDERFATMVRRIDDGVGDLLQTLKDLGIAENTLVVFTSDNGPHHESYLQGKEYDPDAFQSYGPFDGTKRDTWEGGIRMPTLAWWPGNIEASTIDELPSQFHDWMPTFAAAAGTVAPARSDGVSLLPTLTGNGERQESLIYIEYEQNGRTKEYEDFSQSKRGVRRGQMQVLHLDGYKGVRTDIKSHQDPFQIFDLKADPDELDDLAQSSPEFRELERRMRDRVLQVRMPNSSAARPYDSEFVAADVTELNSPGAEWTAYAGKFEYVPQVAELSPIDSGTSDALQLELPAAGAVRWTAHVQVPEDAEVTFRLSTPTKAFLRVHQAAVVDADFGYDAGATASGTIRLAAGLHPIEIISLMDEQGRVTCDVKWSVGDGQPEGLELLR